MNRFQVSDDMAKDINNKADEILFGIEIALSIYCNANVKQSLEKTLDNLTLVINGQMRPNGILNNDKLRIEYLALKQVLENL